MELGSLQCGDLFSCAVASGEPFLVTYESDPPHKMLCRRWAAWHDPAELLPGDVAVTKLTRTQATRWYDLRHQSPRPPRRQGNYGSIHRRNGSPLYRASG